MKQMKTKTQLSMMDPTKAPLKALTPSEMRRAGPGVCAFASSQIDTWLTFILGHLGVAPPVGETWSGHSLRKGAASSSSAIGVSINRICFMGGWSIHGPAWCLRFPPRLQQARGAGLRGDDFVR